jgi:uncharacterized protein YegP (UPF0339 family)
MKTVIRGLVMSVVLAAAFAIGGLYPSDAQAQKDKGKDKGKVAAATAVFEVYQDKSKKFRFRLKDGDDNLLAISGKGYDTRADCTKVIDSIKQNAAKAKVEEEKGK